MEARPFRVIVIGGGPVGIIAAHALHKAGIDFIVLEQRTNIFEDAGASLIVSPHNLRVFYQLGLWEQISQIGAPLLHHSQGFDAKKHKFKRSYALSLLQENHGVSLMAFHRAHLVKAIYSGLPDSEKARYLRGKKVQEIEIMSDGVEITCTDGSIFLGSLAIGADGSHSKTRSIMRRCALQAEPTLASTWDPEAPFTSNYRCLWASFPRLSDSGDSYETQGQDRSIMYLTGREKGWIFLYEKLAQPSNKRQFYDKEALASFGESFATWPINESFTVGDVLGSPNTVAGMTNLEEGVVQNVSWNGRIVLVGDAWHKFTPNSGLGFNNGMQDVVSLCNKLHTLLVRPGISTSRDSPGTKDLQAALNQYQAERYEPLRADFLRSAGATRLSTWETRTDYLLGKYVYSIPLVQRFLTARYICPRISKGLVLDYLHSNGPFIGKLPWKVHS
ncbi:hypothetical protein ACHAPJ_013460 [Fusarium lateritium]